MRSLSKFYVPNFFKRTFPIRLKIGIMLFIGSFMTFMLRSNFSIIILAMNEKYQWSNYKQNLLLSAYFCGYVGPNLIAGFLAERFGGRVIAFLIFFLSSIITALSPYTASISFELLFVSRLILGICAVRSLMSKMLLKDLSTLHRDFSLAHATTLFHGGHHQLRRECSCQVS